MTSIQLNRLSREIDVIQGLINDPPRLRRRIIDLFEFFSDRTRRSQVATRSKDTESRFGVPIPVMSALERALQQAVEQDYDHAQQIADELWQVKMREPRILAIALLEDIPLDALLLRIESWSQDTKDYELLTELSKCLGAGWASEGYPDFREKVSDWLMAKSINRRMFSYLMLRFATSDPQYDEIPSVFRLIRVHDLPKDSRLRRAWLDLLHTLIKRSPAETARFLLDLHEMYGAKTLRLVKGLLSEFPAEEQTGLRRMLSD